MNCQERIEFVNGDDIKITFTIYRNGQIVSLDGATIKFLMSYFSSDELIAEKEGIKTENLGEFIVIISQNDTKGLVGTFDYQVEIKDISGKINTTKNKQISLNKRIG